MPIEDQPAVWTRGDEAGKHAGIARQTGGGQAQAEQLGAVCLGGTATQALPVPAAWERSRAGYAVHAAAWMLLARAWVATQCRTDMSSTARSSEAVTSLRRS